AALTGILIAVTAPAGRADDWARQYAVGGRPEVRILTDDASVTVASSQRRDVEVRVTTQGWAIGPEGARIIENQAGNRVEVEVRLAHRGWGFGNTGHRSVKVELSVPREADLEVRTGDGSVSLQPVSGRVSVETGDGSIKAEGLKGDVRLRTGDGGIDASGLDASLHAATGDGHLRVGGRFDVLDLRTGDGSIDAEAEPG